MRAALLGLGVERDKMLDAAIAALVAITSPVHILHLFFGVAIGLIVGILPGLGGTAGLALLLPFVFGMDPSLALAMMIGLQSVTTTSDTSLSSYGYPWNIGIAGNRS